MRPERRAHLDYSIVTRWQTSARSCFSCQPAYEANKKKGYEVNS